ncbi:lysylphosphatidylglycerol synthase transmembrane domain-containing protein [Methylogaea oryzae]|uniref:Uncharacterized protein n=1 Tax=Methylogaea oryzae TaxID=1295382 RepID=A0A8D4VR03_9GAMM|nr:lysylphosphatidylglycerol synthase transmembrane domain-containing protein [Methylogaea oryzae]BBL70999.1 hypothetical protein MoryE10_16050 [Methylogaea oryzae]
MTKGDRATGIKKKIAFLIKLAISITLLFWLFTKFDLQAHQFTPKEPMWLIVGIVATLIQPAIMGERWRIILSAYDLKTALSTLVKITYLSVFMGQFLPASIGGDAIRVVMIKRCGVRLTLGAVSTVIDRGFALIALFFLVPLAFVNDIKEFQNTETQIIAASLTFLMLVSPLVLAYMAPFFERKAHHRRWIRPIAYIASGMKHLICSPLKIFSVLSISLAVHLLSAVALWSVMMGLGSEISFWLGLTIFPAIILAQMLPVSLGGWGVREVAAISVLGMVGVNPQVALTSSVMLGIFYALASLPGAWYAFQWHKIDA